MTHTEKYTLIKFANIIRSVNPNSDTLINPGVDDPVDQEDLDNSGAHIYDSKLSS